VNGTNDDTGTATDAAAAASGRFGLIWAIKPSFTSYVSRMADGKIYISDGVRVNAENVLLFPYEEAAEDLRDTGRDPAESTFSFRGRVAFQAHFGMLDVRVNRPQVRLRGTDGELTVDDPDSAESARLLLVTFTVASPTDRDGVRYWAADSVQLTEAGVPLFGGTYPAGEPFAPLRIAIPSPPSAAGDHRDEPGPS
jgi:hypothetical protein